MRLADKVATMARRGAPLPYDAEVEWIQRDYGIAANREILPMTQYKGLLSNSPEDKTWKFSFDVYFSSRPTKTSNLYLFQIGSGYDVGIGYSSTSNRGFFFSDTDGTKHYSGVHIDQTGSSFHIGCESDQELKEAFFNIGDFNSENVYNDFDVGHYELYSPLSAGSSFYESGLFARISNIKWDGVLDLKCVRKGDKVGFYNVIDGVLLLTDSSAYSAGPDVVSSRGGGTKCLTPRRSYRRLARSSARFCAHSQEWEVAV